MKLLILFLFTASLSITAQAYNCKMTTELDGKIIGEGYETNFNNNSNSMLDPFVFLEGNNQPVKGHLTIGEDSVILRILDPDKQTIGVSKIRKVQLSLSAGLNISFMSNFGLHQLDVKVNCSVSKISSSTINIYEPQLY